MVWHIVLFAEISPMLQRLLAVAGLIACAAVPLGAGAAALPPTVAVLNFSSDGLDQWWEAGFSPGGALADLVTDQLVNTNSFNVVDRSHLGAVLQEHALSASGEVSPATAVQAGRLIGAQYLVVGRIVQFQRVSENGGNVGNYLGGVLGHAAVSASKVNLNVSVHVIDAKTGRIVQAYNEEEHQTGTSFGVGGFGGGGYGSYHSSQFTSSTMGKLMNQAAGEIAKRVDPAKLTAQAGPAAASVTGKVVAVSGDDYILNIGSANGVQVGQFFDVMKIVQVKDPDTGRMLTSRVVKGKLQITSVDANTSVGKRVSGVVEPRNTVSAE